MKCRDTIVMSLLLAASAWAQQAVDSITDSVPFVDLNVQVTQGDRAVRDLTHGDFRVFDEGVACRVNGFAYPFEPLQVFLLLDISGSLKERQVELAAVARQALGPQSKVSVIPFGEHTNAAIAEAARQLNEPPDKFREQRVIIVLSDNLALHGQAASEQILRELDRARAVLNMIVAPGVKPVSSSLARETGGEVVRSRQTGQALQEMLERIRHRYQLSYSPPPFDMGQTRRIELRLTPEARQRLGSPKPKILTRPGYTVYPVR
ncbi:MAG: hypothetical protein IT162_08085 [Bryobacterales bacterium]|nr:hypothetical protein [Bryobacterales bacterium]